MIYRPSRRVFLASSASVIAASCQSLHKSQTPSSVHNPNPEAVGMVEPKPFLLYPDRHPDAGSAKLSTGPQPDIGHASRPEAFPMVFTLPNDWGAGDCVMKKGAQLTLNPDGNGTFSCIVYTNHTTHGDVWHFSFVLYASDNHAVTFWPPQAGNTLDLDIPNAGVDYPSSHPVSIPANVFSLIDHCEFFGSC